MGEYIGNIFLVLIILLAAYGVIQELNLSKKEIFKYLGIGIIIIISIALIRYIYLLPPTEVDVKYREDKVQVSGDNFEHFRARGLLSNAWYDKTEKYLIVQLDGTNYHYCEVPNEKWNILKTSENPYLSYQKMLKGNFDCRTRYVPAY